MYGVRDDMRAIACDENIRNPCIEIIRTTKVKHQKSKSECGVYSLFYVWARLNGVPPEKFTANIVPDELMFEFRQHIFAGSSMQGGKFDWDEYQKKVNIKWE